MAEVVIDASAMVDLLLDNELGRATYRRVADHVLHAPTHIDAEVLSALGRLHRARTLDPSTVGSLIHRVATAPLQRHPLVGLLQGAWGRRSQLRLADALYIELAASLGLPLVTTDRRLRDAPAADVVTP